MMKDVQGPFAACLSVVNVQPYFGMCLVAACQGTSLCTSMSAYNLACQIAGVLAVPALVDRCGVCLGDGSACSANYDNCAAYGLSHYSSFSGVLFDSQSTCELSFVKDCCSGGAFDIRLRRQLDGTIDLGISVPANTLQLFANGSVLLNNQGLPSAQLSAGSLTLTVLEDGIALSSLSGGLVDYGAGMLVYVQLTNGLTLSYTPQSVTMSVLASQLGNLCGLCMASASFSSVSSMYTYTVQYCEQQ